MNRLVQKCSKSSKGFTLIELMIVIAIIGILAAVALPRYQDYTVRAKVTELMLAATPLKVAVTESVQLKGVMPDTAELASTAVEYDADSGYVKSVIYTGTSTDAAIPSIGVITVTGQVDPRLDGRILTLTGTYTPATGQLTWVCAAPAAGPADGAGIDAKYLPASCK
jgi:type IV pilus assembly protein PilA